MQLYLRKTRFLFILLLVGLAMSCKDEKPASGTLPPPPQAAPAAPEQPQPPANMFQPGAAPATPSAPAASTAAVQHYTCPNNCAGSGGPTQGNCPVCGTAYVHNAAFHNQPGNTTINPTVQQNQSAAPAQNSAGVYHYTCPSGHPGGSGTAGTCAQCGAALAHNQAYHQ